MGIAITFIAIGLVIAYGIWAKVRWNNEVSAVLPLYLLGISVMCLHFLEEYLTGFQRAFPTLIGYQWSDQKFVSFNLLWLAIFILAAIGIYRGIAVAYLIVIFFVFIGGIGNGIGHILLTLATGRYFPGLGTSSLLLIIGIMLWRRLFRKAD